MQWIDFPYEIHKMLYGDAYTKPQGHWVVFRWYDHSKPSKYWDAHAKQTVGGPKYQYRSFALRTTFSDAISPSTNKFMEYAGPLPKLEDIAKRMYLIKKCYNPKIGDDIFEFDSCNVPQEPADFIEFAKTAPATKHRIYYVRPVRIDGKSGIEYFLAFTNLTRGEE
jgi:hypothetical protein